MKEDNYCQNPLGTARKANGLKCRTLMIFKDGKRICPKCDVPFGERNMYERYLVTLGDPHNFFGKPSRVNMVDFELRTSMGKTDDIHVPLCSHIAIINRELGADFCRVCQKDLSKVGEGRYNDYLVIRHPQCFQPICLDCGDNHPDEFHKAYRKGLGVYKQRKADYYKAMATLDNLQDEIKGLLKVVEGASNESTS